MKKVMQIVGGAILGTFTVFAVNLSVLFGLFKKEFFSSRRKTDR